MEYKILLEQFDAIRAGVQMFLNSLVLPESTTTDEEDIYKNVEKIRKQRNQLLKYQIKLRQIKRQVQLLVDEQEDKDAVLIQSLFKSSDNLKGLKTKDERDYAIRAFINASRKDDTQDFKQVMQTVDSVLGDVILAVSELQKCFEEYQLIFNFHKQASMGYLIREAHSKLNDVVSRD